MDIALENDLKRAINIISPIWDMQNNHSDKNTNFIYSTKSLDDCLVEIEKRGVDKEYALHRWYNYHTSVCCEYIFCEFGAIHEKNKYNHDVDIYINNTQFDVKLTVYPAKLSNKRYN